MTPDLDPSPHATWASRVPGSTERPILREPRGVPATLPADGGALSERVLHVYGGDTESRSFSTQPDQDRSARRNLFTSQESQWAINPGNRPSGEIPPGPCGTGFPC